MTKYTFNDVFKYTNEDMDNFISQYTNQNYENINDRRYMTIYYLYENNMLNNEDEKLVTHSNFLQILKQSNTAAKLRQKLAINTWENVLNSWSNGNPLTIPEYATNMNGFEWRTLFINNDASSPYKEVFIESNFDNRFDIKTFKEYMTNTHDAGFIIWNVKGDTKMVIPNYRQGKNFAHLANFMRQADQNQQKEFWKLVAKAVKEELAKMKTGDKLYVSTHGHGVAYLHVRIEHNRPRYFNPETTEYY